jgi:hypothetical protein
LLTRAELDEFETCHSKTPPDTEGVNAADKAVKSIVIETAYFEIWQRLVITTFAKLSPHCGDF